MTTEVVLADGRFATVRRITVGDMCVAGQAASGVAILARLSAMCVTLDDKMIDVDEWLAMDYEYAMPVFRQLSEQLSKAYQHRKGIA